MKINKHVLLLICGVVTIGMLVWFVSMKRVGVPSETIQLSIKPVNINSDLDYLVSHVESLGRQLPNQEDFASNMIRECESMRGLFTESFQTPVRGSIDFILRVHPDSYGRQNHPGYDPERSRKLVSKVILCNKYTFVTFEGSVFDGFTTETRVREVLARLKYKPESPLYKALVQRGVDPNSYEQARPYIEGLVASQEVGVQDLNELEHEAATSFLAGESLPLTILMSKLMSGEIGHSDRKTLIENLQRVRSSYVLAKTIKNLRERTGSSAAIVFGFLHENDFKNLASSLGISGKVYNATGVDWQKLANP